MTERLEPDAVHGRFMIRAPEVGDAPSLGRIHVQIWREAYRGLMPQEALDGLDENARSDRWAGILAAPSSEGQRTRVAVDTTTTQIVGFATAGPPRDQPKPAPTELWSLNTVAAVHGSGLGSRLMGEVLGDGPAYLWVLQGNERAIGFYRKHGFHLDGVARHDPGHGVDDLRMVRAADTDEKRPNPVTTR